MSNIDADKSSKDGDVEVEQALTHERKKLGFTPLLFVIAIIVALVMPFTAPFIQPMIQPHIDRLLDKQPEPDPYQAQFDKMDNELSAMMDGIKQAEMALDTVNDQIITHRHPPPELSPEIVTRLQMMEQQITYLQQQIKVMEQQPKSFSAPPIIENQVPQFDLALFIAANRLAFLIQMGQNFEDSLELFEMLVDQQNPPSPILKRSINSLKTIDTHQALRADQLIVRFTKQAEAIHGQLTATPDGEWWQNILSTISKHISLRETKATDESSLPSVSIALNQLEQLNIKEAVDQLTPYRAQSPLLSDWLEQAETHLQAQSAIAQLYDGLEQIMAAAQP